MKTKLTTFRVQEDLLSELQTRKVNHGDMARHVNTALRLYLFPIEQKVETQIVPVKPKKESKQFVPPHAEEVAAYMRSRGCMDSEEAEKLVDFYGSKGWMIGKNKMKCWKSSVRNWLKSYKAKAKENGAINKTNWAAGLNLGSGNEASKRHVGGLDSQQTGVESISNGRCPELHRPIQDTIIPGDGGAEYQLGFDDL